MLVRHRNPLVEDGAQRIVDALIRTGGREVQTYLSTPSAPGNNTGRYTTSVCTAQNPTGQTYVSSSPGPGISAGTQR
jgi:hypothetical protein